MRKWVVLSLFAAAACGSTAAHDPAAVPVAARATGATSHTASSGAAASDTATSDAAPTPAPTPQFLPGGELNPMSLTGAFSASIQNPSDGWLVGGVPLPLSGRGYAFNPKKDARRRYGTVELVQALMRAAASVDDAHPGAKLIVNDIAMPAGGALEGHASHRNGRDVDVLFYLLGPAGAPYPSKAIPIEPTGKGMDYFELGRGDDDVEVTLDVARTWAFVEALVTDERAHINRIFVVEHVRAMLLAHAEEVGASRLAIARFGDVTCQPKFPHDDHFHIRFYCAVDDIAQGCEDTFPIYPWHDVHLAAEGATVKLARRRATTKKPKVTSVADAKKRARKKYGKFHPDVTAFLERRKDWVKKPHPGRTYCE